MRLAEKTLELNICSQVALVEAASGKAVIWFGLTQRQEARAGFDACVRMGGRLVLLQFKASNHKVRDPARSGRELRRFETPHHQMTALQRQVHSKRSVFYVLPDVGTTAELAAAPFLLPKLYLLDVATIPPLPAPTTRKGVVRRSGRHYVDLDTFAAPPEAVIWSDPVRVPLVPLALLFRADERAETALGIPYETPEMFESIRLLLSRNSAAMIVPR